MAKKLKKRKKLTRRARQDGAPAASAAFPVAESRHETSAASKTAAAQTTPVQPTTAAAAPASPGTSSTPNSPAVPAPPPTVGFRAITKRGPDGIDSKLAAAEYPAIRKDLRKLGLTVAFFVIVLTGLSILGSSTSVISDLGNELFKLWR